MKEAATGKFIFSILTAVITGVFISFVCIEGLKISIRKSFSSKALATVMSAARSDAAEEDISLDEEDPTFISNFSRGFIYSAEDTFQNASLGDLPGDVISTLRDAQPKPVSAEAYSVINLDRNIVVLEKDSDKLMPIASITKLVTAVVAKKLMGENRTITISPEALATEGNTGMFHLGEKFKLSEILYPLLMVSSNDAAEALALEYGRKNFIKEMNDWTNSIGAYRTYFRDPSGLSPNNISTSNDIYIIAKWIKDNEPEIFDITLTKNKSIRTHTWTNPTHFLNLSEYAGGKNGYTPEAKLTSISLFSVGFPKNLYAVVLLGSNERDVDTLAALNEVLK